MKQIFKKLKRKNKAEVFIYHLINILYLVGYIYFAINVFGLVGVETFIRYSVLVGLVLFFIFMFFFNMANIIKKKHASFIFTTFIAILIIIIFFASGFVINKIFGVMDNMKDEKKVTYTSYLINLKDSQFDKSESSIGRIEDQSDKEGYILANKIIVNNKLNNTISNYSDYMAMLQDLYDKKIDAIFVQSNYISYFNSEEDFQNIAQETKIIYEYSEEMENDDTNISSSKDFTDPVTFLILGVDSKADGLNANAAFNGDTLMLITFNPNTLNATVFSIPRDTFVPIACKKNNKAKINSSAAYGTKCVISTIEQLMDIDIDYYVKINFKGVVDLVDALGGVEVNVQAPEIKQFGDKVCEQDSNRKKGDSLVCMNPGLQKLNGEQALAYSRCRHLYISSDLTRIKHQQDVVTAIAKKSMTLRNFKDFEKVLNAVTKNIATNMNKNQMLSAYNVIKKIIQNNSDDEMVLNIQKTYLETQNLNVYLPSSKRYTSALSYFPDSLNEIKHAMKVNLELEKAEPIKTFEFSYEKEFKVNPIGLGKKGNVSEKVLKKLAGMSVNDAKTYCSSAGISCTFETVSSDSELYNSTYGSGLVAGQSVHDGTLLSLVSKVTVYVNK